MSLYTAQLGRIKAKLEQAKTSDANRRVFGASNHQYAMNAPTSLSEVEAFETQYSISLPDCYRAFVTEIGNGGPSFLNSAAGPYYGIYPMGHDPGELLYGNPEKYLKQDCVLFPRMSEEEWKSLNALMEGEEDLSDEVYEAERGKVFGGILPLGSQGCTYLHGIVLNGPHRGRMVNLDMDLQRPRFCFEKNFLDWYERWLDEVISGQLITDGTTWFGFVKGGTETALLNDFFNSADAEDKTDSLAGLENKKSLSAQTLNELEKGIALLPEFSGKLAMLLCKFDYARAKPHLAMIISQDLRSVAQSIHWYAKRHSAEWSELIRNNLHQANDAETFNFCTYVLMDSGAEYSAWIMPFLDSPVEDIRGQAFYALGKLKKQEDHIQAFIRGLNDPALDVVVMVLRMLEGVKDERLLPAYQKLARQFPEDHSQIAPHLDRCLAVFGLDRKTMRGE